MNEEDKNKYWTLTRISIISTISLVGILGIFAVFFFWNRTFKPFNSNYVADNELLGNFGDFAAATLGLFLALFSSILLVWTFVEQRNLTIKTNKENEAQSELQRFNDLFFELLNLLQKNEERMNEEIDDFFNNRMEYMRDDFGTYSRQGDAVRYAKDSYLDFYSEHAYILAPYFRTLYRIFNLIDNSSINDDNKLEYAKVVRAQLSEGNLFFLRYNCTTPHGRNFIEYVNKYRLLKHLPFLSLMEERKFADTLLNGSQTSKKNLSVNVLLYDLMKEIYNRVVGNTELIPHPVVLVDTAKYKISLVYTNKNRPLVIRLERDNSVRKTHKRMMPFNNFSDYDLAQLIFEFMRDLLSYSNYGIYNPEVYVYRNVAMIGDVSNILITVTNPEPLRLSHPCWDDKYNRQS